MKIKGNITFLVNSDGTTIEIEDELANIRFVRVKLTPEQLSQALARVAFTECAEVSVLGLERVGKVYEHQSFEFELPEHLSRYDRNQEELKEYAKRIAPEGWVCQGYFNSQNSFFEKDGKTWARTTIHRWVDKEE